ncbi:MAG: MFS transporter, partial [Candidatus Hydrogenedentes bacterium]|nr:MFS transporter [Candidatus Hydrogenedentota bacterium]
MDSAKETDILAPDTTGAASLKANYQRGFWALIATQFQGAFNDNLFKWIIVFLMLDVAARVRPDLSTDWIVSAATIVFALPFILFPGTFGAFSDRFSKQRVTIGTKYLEIVIMLFGVAAFLLKEPLLLLFLLFMMAAQSAIFSPSKYGLLPEILPEERLSWGNGIIALFTIVAIIVGTWVAGPLYQYFGRQVYWVGLILVVLSCSGLLTSYAITRPPAANPMQRIPLNPWAGMGKAFEIFWSDRWLLLTVLGYVYFWFAGTLLQQNIIKFAHDTLRLGETQITNLNAALAVGIGIGSLAAGYLSRGKIEVGLIPIGALGLAACSALLALPDSGYRDGLIFLFGMGFFAGMYDVPLAATLQHRSPDDYKGSILAASNMLTFVGIALAGALFYGLGYIGVTTHGVFLINAILSLVVGIYICSLLPMFLLRTVLWMLTSTIYRIHVRGRQNIPEKGGALLIANHTSFVDALFILVSIDRHIRFIVASEIYEVWWIRPLAKMMRAIPISPMATPRQLLESLHAATDAIHDGELVCIFAEGQITRTGQMLPFRKGFERIIKGTNAPIVPVHLDRLWGSIFSFAEHRFFWKVPSHIPYPITVSYGAPMPSDSSAFDVRNVIRELGTEAYGVRKQGRRLLHRALARCARLHPFRLAMADLRVPKLSYLFTLVGSIVMSRKLKKILDAQPMTGVLVPPSVGGALANIALQIMGKVPINLNYTASSQGILSAARQCNLAHVITSRAFLEKLPLEVPGQPIYLEDVVASVRKGDRIIALLLALFCPVRLLERVLGARGKRTPDDLAAIIFSSGSEGEPKGVMLSHHNVMSNIEATLQVFPTENTDRMMGILPFFHSFGFMGTLWLPLVRGLATVYYPNPLDAKVIGGLVYQHRITFLISTPTFLQNFIRRCAPEEFSSLKYVVTGAEKLPERIREAFKTKFGLEPLEGYGTTECAPAVSVNVPDFRAPGFYQVGTKHGTIGQPIPGVSVRVVNPDTGALQPQGEPGLLEIKGPNIMKGYLNQPEKTATVLKDGWYNTGDMAFLDEDGFITITDRLSRFSKIAGEMVPHTKIEEVLHALLNLTEQTLAVVGVPDATKGERLVVLHTLKDGQVEELQSKLDQSGLPNLWLPRAGAFYKIEQLPVLGTGKLDPKASRNSPANSTWGSKPNGKRSHT